MNLSNLLTWWFCYHTRGGEVWWMKYTLSIMKIFFNQKFNFIHRINQEKFRLFFLSFSIYILEKLSKLCPFFLSNLIGDLYIDPWRMLRKAYKSRFFERQKTYKFIFFYYFPSNEKWMLFSDSEKSFHFLPLIHNKNFIMICIQFFIYLCLLCLSHVEDEKKTRTRWEFINIIHFLPSVRSFGQYLCTLPFPKIHKITIKDGMYTAICGIYSLIP